MTPTSAALSARNLVEDSTILSATSEAALFRKESLVNPLRSVRWRSTAATKQQIVGQFDAASAPTVLALVDSNLQTPASDLAAALAQAQVWLKADAEGLSDGAAVSGWTNRGSLGGLVAFSQATGSKQPSFQTNEIDSNKPVVRFDGGDVLGLGADLSFGTSHVIVLVVNVTTDTGEAVIVGSGSSYVSLNPGGYIYYYASGTGVTLGSSPAAAAFYVVTIVRSGLTVTCYVNGTQNASPATMGANATFNLRYVGSNTATPSATLTGDIAEVFLATSLTEAQRRAVEDYLYAKYNRGGTNLGSVMLELASDSAFTSSPLRWVFQSYAQTARGVMRWYLDDPALNTPALSARSFWRLTIPASASLDTDGDGVADTYYELGVPWLGTYVELPIDFGMSIEATDRSLVVVSDAGARVADILPTFHTIEAEATAMEEASTYALLALLDEAGVTRHCLLDVWAPTTDATKRAMGCYYGHLGGDNDTAVKLTRSFVGRDDVAISFVEARA